MNEIFKSEVGLKQELDGTKKRENSFVPHYKWYTNRYLCSVKRYVCSERLVPFQPNGCVCSGNPFQLNGCICSSKRMCLFETTAPVPSELMCLFGNNPFRPNRFVCSKRLSIPTEQMFLFGIVAPIPIE